MILTINYYYYFKLYLFNTFFIIYFLLYNQVKKDKKNLLPLYSILKIKKKKLYDKL